MLSHSVRYGMYDCLNSVKTVKTDDRNCMSYMYLYNLYTSYLPNFITDWVQR